MIAKVRHTPAWVGSVVTMAVLAALAFGAFRWFGHHHASEDSEAKSVRVDAPVAVTVDAVVYRPIRRTLSVVGSLWGWEELSLTAKVEGRVARIRHEVGDRVKPGEILFELDPTDYELAVSESQRGLELELAKLGLKDLPNGVADLGQLPMVQRANSLKAQAKAKAERLRKLQTNRAVSAEDFEQAETDLAVANANVLQANLETQSTLAAARHRLAMLDSARQRLTETKVVIPAPSLPVPGSAKPEYVVTQRNVAEGEMVRVFGPDMSPQFRLAIDQLLKLQATIPERFLGEVQVGQDVEIRVEAYANQFFAGKISRLHPAVDRASRTFKAEITVPNPERKLSPGSFVRAEIITKPKQIVPTVAEEAIVSFAGVNKVFTVQDGQAKVVPVKLGRSIIVNDKSRSRTWIEIEAVLSEGMTVVTSGQSKLSAGTPVRVR